MRNCNQVEQSTLTDHTPLNAEALKQYMDCGRFQRSLIVHQFLKSLKRRFKLKSEKA